MLLEPVVVLVTIGGARTSSADTASIANSADSSISANSVSSTDNEFSERSNGCVSGADSASSDGRET